MRLTKKREAELHTALCIDDVLYEKFRRLNEDLNKREQRFQARKQVKAVYQLTSNGIHMALQILDVKDSGEGLIVMCR